MQVEMRRRGMAGAAAFAILMMASCAVLASSARGQAKGAYELRGDLLTARFQIGNSGLKVIGIVDRRSNTTLQPGEAFSLVLRDGRVISASQMTIYSSSIQEQVAPDPKASRAAERLGGRRICADLSTVDNLLTAHWCAVLRKEANYLRQEVTLKAGAQAADISEVRLFDFEAPGA